MTPDKTIEQQNEIIDGLRKHIGAVSDDRLNGFIRGYQQGYKDAQYVYDKNAARGIEPGYSGAAMVEGNDLYVSSGCSCANAMYCDGACFPRTKGDWK